MLPPPNEPFPTQKMVDLMIRNYSPPIIPALGLNKVVFAGGIRGSHGFPMLNFLERRVLKALVYKKAGVLEDYKKLGCKEGGKDTYPPGN